MNEDEKMPENVKKTGRGHILCEKAPWLVLTVGTFSISFFFPLVGILSSAALQQILPFDKDIGEALLCTASSFLLLWLIKWWFSPEYEGSMRLHVPVGDVVRWSVPLWGCLACGIAVEAWKRGEFYFHLTFGMVALCLMAGFLEEAIYRAFVVPVGMRYLSGENRVWWTAAFSMGVFALAHLPNVLSGAPLDITIVQVVGCLPFGLFAVAVMLRSGSVLPTAVMHTLMDIIAMSTTPNIGDGVMRGAVEWDLIVSVVLEYIVLATFGVWMIKKYKPEILALWDRKWGLSSVQTEGGTSDAENQR